MADIPVFASDALVVVDVTFDGQVNFDYDFRADNLEDLSAIYRPPSGESVYLQGGVDFTASGLGGATGGQVTLTTFVSTVENATLTIYRNTIIQRLTDFTRDLFANAINRELDHVFMILQELRRALESTISVAPGITPPDVAALLELLQNVENLFPPIEPGQEGYVLTVREDLLGYENAPPTGGGGGSGDAYASQAEAEAGTLGNRVMSPVRTWDAMRKRSKWETIIDADFGPGKTFTFLDLGAFDFLNLRLRGVGVSGSAGAGKLELSSDNGSSWIQTNYLYNFIYQDSTPGMGGLNGTGGYILIADGSGWSTANQARVNLEMEGFNKNLQTTYESRVWNIADAGGLSSLRQSAGVQTVAAVHNAFRLVFSQSVAFHLTLDGKRG